jgi:hypothetical protein
VRVVGECEGSTECVLDVHRDRGHHRHGTVDIILTLHHRAYTAFALPPGL